MILPFAVLRRLDCVFAPTKAEVLKEHAAKQAAGIAFEPFVKRKAGLDFYNVSSLDMGKLMGDQDQLARPGQRDHGRRDGRGERAHDHEQAGTGVGPAACGHERCSAWCQQAVGRLARKGRGGRPVGCGGAGYAALDAVRRKRCARSSLPTVPCAAEPPLHRTRWRWPAGSRWLVSHGCAAISFAV